MLHLNIRSLWPKIDLLRQYIYENKNINVFTISESWLTPDITDNLLNIDDHTLYRLDRSWGDTPHTTKKGGGVCMYVRNDLDASYLLLKESNISTQHGEIQWLSIQNDYCKNIIIANCYRPPSGKVENFVNLLERNLLTLDKQKNDIFVIGDLNIDFS